MLPLCMKRRELWVKGWQFVSERFPSVVARTWAKIREEVVLEARRVRLGEFQAGVVEVKMQGVGPRVGGV